MKAMQNMKTTLSVKLKNTPWNSSHVPSSVSGWLNREETLSAVRIGDINDIIYNFIDNIIDRNRVLADNIGDENLLLNIVTKDRTCECLSSWT